MTAILGGKGVTGKATLLEILNYVLGDLVGPIQAELLLEQKSPRSSAGPSPDIMALRGKRIAWGSETDEGRKINAGKVKWLVGGDTLVGRVPFGKREVAFKPSHLLFLLTNFKPRVNASDFPLWERIHLIPFKLSFVEKPTQPHHRKIDHNLLEDLKEEAPGILAWLVQGFREYKEKGLQPPSAVLEATQDYKKEEDVIGLFISDCCVTAECVGKEISGFTHSLSGRKATHSHWVPRETTAPTDLWQERARRLAEESENWLFHHHTFAQTMLGWLKEHRGLSEETIKEHRLGLVLIDRFEGHDQWGLEPVFKDDGTPKKIWIPRGLTIPLCQDGKIYRIRIRRPKFALRSEADPRYYLLRGSDTRAIILGTDKSVSIIVESELDALLLHQEAGDLVNVISLGNAQSPGQGSCGPLTAKPADPPGPRCGRCRR